MLLDFDAHSSVIGWQLVYCLNPVQPWSKQPNQLHILLCIMSIYRLRLMASGSVKRWSRIMFPKFPGSPLAFRIQLFARSLHPKNRCQSKMIRSVTGSNHSLRYTQKTAIFKRRQTQSNFFNTGEAKSIRQRQYIVYKFLWTSSHNSKRHFHSVVEDIWLYARISLGLCIDARLCAVWSIQ